MGGQASRQTETSDLEYPAFTILRLPFEVEVPGLYKSSQ